MATELNEAREYIRNSGLSQEDWARRAGLKYWTLQKFMSQVDTDPRASTFIAVLRAIDAHRAEQRKPTRSELRAAQ